MLLGKSSIIHSLIFDKISHLLNFHTQTQDRGRPQEFRNVLSASGWIHYSIFDTKNKIMGVSGLNPHRIFRKKPLPLPQTLHEIWFIFFVNFYMSLGISRGNLICHRCVDMVVFNLRLGNTPVLSHTIAFLSAIGVKEWRNVKICQYFALHYCQLSILCYTIYYINSFESLEFFHDGINAS